MYKYIPLGCLLLAMSYSSASANWINENATCDFTNSIDITTSTTVVMPKIEGKYTLCVREYGLWNPFATSTIVACSGNACTAQYMVNGSWYDPSHPLWQYRDATTNAPNQIQMGWLFAKKSYWYDKTPPVCGPVIIKNKLSKEYNGGWTKDDLYVNGSCSDALSGCNAIKNSASFSAKLSHLAKVAPLATLFDNVDNSAALRCPLSQTVLVDQGEPTLELSLSGSDIIVDPDTGKATLYQLAGPMKFNIAATDEKTNSYGVSGIKSIKAVVTKTKDYKDDPVTITSPICQENYTISQPYNPDGTKIAPHRESIELNCSDTSGIQEAGTYLLTITIIDEAGNIVTKEITIIISPNNNIAFNTKFTLDTSFPFANHKDSYYYTMSVVDSYMNLIRFKKISALTVPEEDDIDIDETDSSSDSALDIYDQDLITNNEGQFKFKVKSYTPGFWKENFSFSFPTWNESYVDIGMLPKQAGGKGSLPFFSLFKGKITLQDDAGVPINSALSFGEFQRLRVDIQRYVGAPMIVPMSINLHKNGDNAGYLFDWISSTDATSMDVRDESILETVIDGTNDIYNQTARFVLAQIARVADNKVGLVAKPLITYQIDGKITRYRLSESFTGSVKDLVINNTINNPIYIEGYKSTAGVDGVVLDKVNIGQVKLIEFSNNVRKAWALKIRNREITSGQIFEDIKYIEGDITLSGSISGYKTLVIVDGNLTIDGDINTDKQDFGIVLLRTVSGSDKANIFIKPNVKIVSAIIYADGSIESVDENGNKFLVPNAARSAVLKNQIVFYGALYTRNTVGGAVYSNTRKKYLLPSGAATDNFGEAVRYDLSFLRMKNTDHDKAPLKDWNQKHTESVIILSDPTRLTNDLPILSTK